MKKRDNWTRLLAIGIMFIAVAVLYIGRLLFLQVSGQDYYSMSTPVVTYTRTVPIQAQRGEIYDRNGVPLVTNSYARTLSLDYKSKPGTDTELNELLLAVRGIAAETGEAACLNEPEDIVSAEAVSDGLIYRKPDGFGDTSRGRRYRKLLNELSVEEDAGIEAEGNALLLYFGITVKETDPVTKVSTKTWRYDYETAAELFNIRLDMVLDGFSPVQPYPLANDVSLNFLTAVEERFGRGFQVSVSADRVYHFPGYASHIIGYVGKIPADDVEFYTAEGYAMDAIVGRTGSEAAFEEYLRGRDGVLTITEDEYGNVLSTEITKEPEAGQDIYLTIDIRMQIVAEKALAENIFQIRAEANPNKALTGEDASAGALTVLDVHTSEILAIASYPTFNLATFWEDFSDLNNDPVSPLYNRALFGTYAPGSTFKIGVAIAALSEKIITKDTIINTKGIYTYYEDSGYTPRCWLYLLAGESHGPINVVEAIQESCNYFFFDVSRQLTIEKMNEYCISYGLGQPTGVELPEKTGILAGPDYRADHGMGQWSPGDTLQAGIGQSDNLFTPLQISCYLNTVLNSGTRYAAHLLYKVHNYGEETPVYTSEPQILSKIKISDEILGLVREGMKGVMDNGSAASVFSGYEISVGGKTGTAQVYTDKSDNGIMMAFAPFDDPEIVVTSVIEQGSGGTEAGYAIRDIFDYYFNLDEIRAAKAAAEAAQRAAEEEYYEDDEESYDDGEYDDWEYEEEYEDYEEYEGEDGWETED